jgi:hypothetical protein
MVRMPPENTDPNSGNLRFPRWQRELEAAILETDLEKLPGRLEAAEAAIFLRSQELVDSPDDHAERQAISLALRALRNLQTERLNYPDWNKR